MTKAIRRASQPPSPVCPRTRRAKAWAVVSVAVLVLLSVVPGSARDGFPLIVFFYGAECASCDEMEEFLSLMTFGQPASVIARHEISASGSIRLLTSLSRAYKIDVPSEVPVVFVSDEVYVGMEGRAQELAMTKTIGDCFIDPVLYGCESPIAKLPGTQIRQDLPRLAVLLGVFLVVAWLQIR